jgi:hypothetical protein
MCAFGRENGKDSLKHEACFKNDIFTDIYGKK